MLAGYGKREMQVQKEEGEAMKEYPILFSTEMVRAILDGRKTMTRRAVKPQPDNIRVSPFFTSRLETSHGYEIKCPYGQVGDRLWVRETFMLPPYMNGKLLKEGADTWPQYVYIADEDKNSIDQWLEWKWKKYPSIFMRREYSRITLEITNIKVERLQEITGEDAISEGVKYDSLYGKFAIPDYEQFMDAERKQAKYAFQKLWDSINGKKHPWSSNPFVWCLTFKRV